MKTIKENVDDAWELGQIDTDRYYNKGFDSANVTARTNPERITSGLDEAFKMFRDDSKEITKRRIRKLEDDVERLTVERDEKKEEKIRLETEKKQKEIEKEALIKERDALEKKAGLTNSLTPLITLGAGLILLTLFVFTFYFYVGKITVVPMIGDIIGVGQSTAMLPILFPFVVLAFALLIDQCLKKIKQGGSIAKKATPIAVLSGVLLLALGLDTIMGSMMSENAHAKAFNAGLVSTEWRDAMIWSDKNFYVVLILGFASYVVWGILFHNFFSHPNFHKPEEIRKLNERIAAKQIEILNMEGKIDSCEAKLAELSDMIEVKKEQISNYKNGGVYYDIPRFRGVIGRFMEGYKAFVDGAFKTDDSRATETIDIASASQEKWIEERIATLEGEV